MIVTGTGELAGQMEHEQAARLCRGRLDAFLRSIERRALRMAQLATGNLDDALELVQDSMLVFVRSYRDKPEADWPPLFWRVLDSRVHDHHRRQSVRQRWRVFFGRSHAQEESDELADPLAAVADAGTAGPLERALDNESRVAIERALRALPDRQRQAFLLRVWEGLDGARTAAAMGCSEGSVKTHLFRALAALRKHLEEHR
jgi:RNA polymerase sigma-70 factor (ECF subfamily)